MSAARPPSPFAIRDFRLLWIGEAVSALGDQFALIALPWLALVLTGSSLALGGVLALMAVPRAVLMLVGGVWVDRISPRRVMLASNTVRLLAVSGLALLVLAGAASFWMLGAFALLFGIADAFFFPAQSSIVPELVEAERLQTANAIVQGTAQGSVLVGPAVAGFVIAALGSRVGAADHAGIAVALLIDGASFVASLATLWLIQPRPRSAAEHPPMLDAIREALRFLVGSPALRAVVLLSLTANLLITGPFEIGLPVLAYARFPEGAVAFGILMSAFGGGSLVGYAAGAALPAPRPDRLGSVVVLSISLGGLALPFLAAVQSTIIAAILTGIAGVGLGYGNLLGITWIQSRIPSALMGRVMSLMMLGAIALVPVSELVAGSTVAISLQGTLIVAGVAMVAVSLLALLSTTVRNLGLQPPYDPAGEERATGAGVARPAQPVG